MTGLLEDKATIFLEELWSLMLSASKQDSGIPIELIKQKQSELEMKKQKHQDLEDKLKLIDIWTRRKTPEKQ